MGLLPRRSPTMKTLCKPCAISLERDHKLKALPGRTEKITCAQCNRRRYGLAYEVTKK